MVEHFPAWIESRGEVWPTREEAEYHRDTLPVVMGPEEGEYEGCLRVYTVEPVGRTVSDKRGVRGWVGDDSVFGDLRRGVE